MAFASEIQARLPLGPLARGFLTTLQASLDAADWPVARPLYEAVFLRFDPGLSPDAGSAATGDPGVGPDSHRLAAVSLSLGYVVVPSFRWSSAPELLDAHSAGIGSP